MFREKSTAAEAAMPTASAEIFATSAPVSATPQAYLKASLSEICLVGDGKFGVWSYKCLLIRDE